MTRVHVQPRLVALVASGGAAGTAVRYLAARSAHPSAGHWPTSTFVVNLLGAFVLGALVEALLRAGPDDGRRRRLRHAIGTGFCGGLTTYSTLAVEVARLAGGGRLGLAVAYAAASIVGGLLAAGAGALMGRRR